MHIVIFRLYVVNYLISKAPNPRTLKCTQIQTGCLYRDYVEKPFVLKNVLFIFTLFFSNSYFTLAVTTYTLYWCSFECQFHKGCEFKIINDIFITGLSWFVCSYYELPVMTPNFIFSVSEFHGVLTIMFCYSLFVACCNLGSTYASALYLPLDTGFQYEFWPFQIIDFQNINIIGYSPVISTYLLIICR